MSNRKELCKRIDLILRLVPSPPMRYTLDSLLTDLLARGDNKPDQAATIEQLQADNAKLREALQLLQDNQNGCPLPKYEIDWNEAMRLSYELLGETK